MEVEEATVINPADYFNPERPRPDPGLLRRGWYPTVFTAAGFAGACFINFCNRKPLMSGVQQHIIGTAIGMIAGVSASGYVERRAAHRDAVIYQYIVSHPDDFPPIERKKYADVIQKWVPIR